MSTAALVLNGVVEQKWTVRRSRTSSRNKQRTLKTREQPAIFRNDRTRNPNTDLDRKAENENKENASKSEKKQKQESRGSSVAGACVSCGRETRALPTRFVCPKEIPSGVTLLAESQKHENRLRRSTSDQPQRSRPLLQVFVSTIVTR